MVLYGIFLLPAGRTTAVELKSQNDHFAWAGKCLRGKDRAHMFESDTSWLQCYKIVGETITKTCTNEKKLLLSNGTSYVIHHKFQTTSTRTRNLPIEQSIYSPDITNRSRGKTGIFLPKNPKNHENDKDTRSKTYANLYSTI